MEVKYMISRGENKVVGGGDEWIIFLPDVFKNLEMKLLLHIH